MTEQTTPFTTRPDCLAHGHTHAKSSTHFKAGVPYSSHLLNMSIHFLIRRFSNSRCARCCFRSFSDDATVGVVCRGMMPPNGELGGGPSCGRSSVVDMGEDGSPALGLLPSIPLLSSFLRDVTTGDASVARLGSLVMLEFVPARLL
jgi:hypothetical protein